MNKDQRRRYLGPLLESGRVLAVPRPGGERLFPGDRFTPQDALRFFYPELFGFIRKHEGYSTTQLAAKFGPGIRQTLRRLEEAGVLRHTEGPRTRGAVTYQWYEVK
jgi:hypothetical protein